MGRLKKIASASHDYFDTFKERYPRLVIAAGPFKGKIVVCVLDRISPRTQKILSTPYQGFEVELELVSSPATIAAERERSNGIVKNGKITWARPPRWGEMESGSYNDLINILRGNQPAALPNVGPGISDKLASKQNLADKKGMKVAMSALEGLYEERKKSRT